MNLNKENVLNAIENGVMEVDNDYFVHVEDFAHGRLIKHDVELPEELEGNIVEVAYPEYDHIRHLREDLEEEMLFADDSERDGLGYTERYNEILDELQYYLSGEHNDVYDYDAAPLVYINGELQ